MSSGERIPYDQALGIANVWIAKLNPYCDRAETAGSIRRQKETVGDIEIVALPRLRDLFAVQKLIGPDYERFLEGSQSDPETERGQFYNLPTIKAKPSGVGATFQQKRHDWIRATALKVAARLDRVVTFKGGWPGKMTQIALPEGIVLDLFTPVPDAFALVLMIRTGSADFSHAMAQVSASRGWIWRDGRVYRRKNNEPDGSPVSLPTEQAVFDLFGVRWVPPEYRADQGTVLAYLTESLPPRAVEAIRNGSV